MDPRYVQRLSGARWNREVGWTGILDLLIRAELSASEGVILNQEAHLRFLESSGLAEDIVSSAHLGKTIHQQASRLRRRYRLHELESELSQAIRGAVLDLGARTVAVHSHERSVGGLGTIPDVLSAVRRAWLSPAGLKCQLAAVADGDPIPTWTILIQREIY